ncbi:MAG: hypothetical protein IJD83_04740, partial [Clostridia bacterium]|nr:hypothetical protein [Clostridia bacterium]
ESYANASLEYKYIWKTAYGGPKEMILKNCAFPFEIKYRGELDASGNSLSTEELKFFQHSYNLPMSSGHVYSEYKYSSLLKPTIIKDKEYIGFESLAGLKCNFIVTVNNFQDFDALSFDAAEGVSDWE